MSAVAVAIFMSLPLVRRWRAMRELHEVMQHSAVVPVGRFSGIEFVRTRSSHARNMGELQTLASVASVMQLANDDRRLEGAAALALILAGRPHQAIARLERAARAVSNDAAMWNDLAAARLQGGDEQLLRALTNIDFSLRLDGNHAEARVNRALILQRLGVDESRLHSSSAAQMWPAAEAALFDSVQHRDSAGVRRIVARFPQQTRTYVEGPYLSRWADDLLANRLASAGQYLAVARSVGNALRERNADTFITDVVSTIDRALLSPDPDDERQLAAAQVRYRSGRIALSRRNPAAAVRELSAAASSFEQLKSPMASLAAYFEANALYDSNRIGEARGLLHGLASSSDLATHRALHAQVSWTLGLCEGFFSHWNESFRMVSSASSEFAALGEDANRGAVAALMAENLDRVGLPQQAWPHRIEALRLSSAAGDLDRMQVAVIGGVWSAMHAGDWELARSLSDIQQIIAHAVRRPDLVVAALARRAIIEHSLGDAVALDLTLKRARVAESAIGDSGLRAEARADIDVAEAIVRCSDDPASSVRLLTGALDFYVASDRRIRAPEILLWRGRAYIASRDTDRALADFTGGMREIEEERRSALTPELRARFFDVSEDLFVDQMRLLYRSRDVQALFAAAEAVRARTLLDARTKRQDVTEGAPVTLREVQKVLPSRTALLEYVVLPERLLIICVDATHARIASSQLPAADLEHRIAEYQRALQSDDLDRIRMISAELYRIVLLPVAEDIRGAVSLLISAHKSIQSLPFAALVNPQSGRYLIETHTIAYVPSGAFADIPGEPAGRARSVLVVAGGSAASTSLAPLAAAPQEALAVSALYAIRRLLSGRDATRQRFQAEVSGYDVVHFAGHGISDSTSIVSALVFEPNGANDKERFLYAEDVAKWNLTRQPIVVLAACGTARGDASSLEGMPSLARSFLEAGASEVVGTFWDIDDRRSQSIAVELHRGLARGVSAAGAIRNVQRAQIARSQPPSAWAAFAIFGSRSRND